MPGSRCLFLAIVKPFSDFCSWEHVRGSCRSRVEDMCSSKARIESKTLIQQLPGLGGTSSTDRGRGQLSHAMLAGVLAKGSH